MPLNRNKSEQVSEALKQGFRVLQAFTADNPILSLTQVATRADLDSVTAFHLVQTLVVLGYVERIAGSKLFRLTLKPLELGFNAIAHNAQSTTLKFEIDKGTKRSNSSSDTEVIANRFSLSELGRNPK
jgi:IclR family transcriptional regulator, pca regulon regulatory protein